MRAVVNCIADDGARRRQKADERMLQSCERGRPAAVQSAAPEESTGARARPRANQQQVELDQRTPSTLSGPCPGMKVSRPLSSAPGGWVGGWMKGVVLR
jgi:hypothetical protein